METHGIAGRLAAEVERMEEENSEAGPREVRPETRRQGLWAFLFGSGQAEDGVSERANPDYDERLIEAARIAERRARARSIRRCWRFVKQALLKAEVVESYPRTVYARQAGTELTRDFGFHKIDVTDPHQAPVGAVLVYGGRGAGHVEIRTETGFVSDHASNNPSRRPLTGVYVKPRE